MAIKQPLRGNSDKIYEVITDFSKGLNKNVGDDVALDSSFKDLKNFYNASEGYLSKRPGVVNSNIASFIDKIVTNDYDPTKFVIVNNQFGETEETQKTRLRYINDVIFKGLKKTGTALSGTQFTFQEDKIIGFELLKNNFFLDAMQDYSSIFEGKYSEVAGSNIIEFACILVAGGFYTTITGENESAKKNGIFISRLAVKLEFEEDHYNVSFETDYVDSTMNPKLVNGTPKCRWDYLPDDYKDGEDNPKPAKSIDIANYNGYSYITSGTNYLARIKQNPTSKTATPGLTDESDIIVQIGGYDQSNLYQPTPIELNQVGFNILHNNPLEYYRVSGSTAKIRGVFYSKDVTYKNQTVKQPIGTSVPYNGEFYIHILCTGSTAPNRPQYRQDNGETDEELNPYKDLPGSFVTGSTSIFKCTGIDSDQKFELKITIGSADSPTDTFISYFTTTTDITDETSYMSKISELIFSSTHCKVINEQLVLYGGHGYIFFSEFEDFTYFPNYYYVYIASEAGEEQVTNISYFRQYHAIFTNKRIKRMSGSFGVTEGENAFGIYPLNDYIGCPNGRTVRALGNNLLFLGNDGLYKLKQGYLGEGTENIEKIDEALGNELNLNNVVQAFVLNNNYVVVKNDGRTWIVYNTQTEAFYEYELEPSQNKVYDGEEVNEDILNKALSYYSIFQANLYDAHGDFFIVPMHKYTYNDDYTEVNKSGIELMLFRFNDLDFLDTALRHKDAEGFISSFETHYINMGYPTHTKKFKELYIKMINESGHSIPLYITIMVDDTVVMSPKDYVVLYNASTDTYYYTPIVDNNYEIDTSKALGEFTLGKDKLGNKTIQQIKIKVRAKGRAIKIKLNDGYDDTSAIVTKGEPVRNRNLYNFSISSIGITYKLKKVKEG